MSRRLSFLPAEYTADPLFIFGFFTFVSIVESLLLQVLSGSIVV